MNKSANRLFHEVIDEAEKLGYRPNCDQAITTFSSSIKWGNCVSFLNGRNAYFSKISVNELALSNQRLLLSVLVHEVAHAIFPKDHHGKKWREAGNRIGERFGIIVSTTIDGPVLSAASKYIVGCPRCNKTWGFQRLCQTVKFPELYQCRDCGEDLVRIK